MTHKVLLLSAVFCSPRNRHREWVAIFLSQCLNLWELNPGPPTLQADSLPPEAPESNRSSITSPISSPINHYHLINIKSESHHHHHHSNQTSSNQIKSSNIFFIPDHLSFVTSLARLFPCHLSSRLRLASLSRLRFDRARAAATPRLAAFSKKKKKKTKKFPSMKLLMWSLTFLKDPLFSDSVYLYTHI